MANISSLLRNQLPTKCYTGIRLGQIVWNNLDNRESERNELGGCGLICLAQDGD
jgi:hypothetical protein